MRSIINISVPSQVKSEVEIAVKNGGYASKSELFRDLWRTWKQKQLLSELEQSRKEIKCKKGKILKSLKDLR